jgi:hypothetical protein
MVAVNRVLLIEDLDINDGESLLVACSATAAELATLAVEIDHSRSLSLVREGRSASQTQLLIYRNENVGSLGGSRDTRNVHSYINSVRELLFLTPILSVAFGAGEARLNHRRLGEIR